MQPDLRQGSAAGKTVQLGADFLTYARERYDAGKFKDALVERLLPTVPRSGEPREIHERQAFGKFDILEKLGKGGMAHVYLAQDPERPSSGSGFGSREQVGLVALKVMKSEIAHNPEYVARFLREAANTALIEHTNVVQVFEVGSVQGRLYFTMELIEGVTLKDHLKQGPMSEEDGVQVLCQLVDGLTAAHERGIGHRDLKPSNLMIVTSEDKYGFGIQGEFDVHIKVTDFGLAHQMELDKSEVVPGGRFLGTAKYVAPEVVRGEPTTLKSDVFSLGILAFQMFAGKPPFRARNKMEYITANLNDEAPLLHTRVPVSHDLSRLVDAMLRKDPEARPDGDAVRRDLGRLAAREGREPIVVDDPTSTFHGEPTADWTDRVGGADMGNLGWNLPLVAGAVGLVLVVLAVAKVMWGGDDSPEPPPPAVASTSTAPTPTPARTPGRKPAKTPKRPTPTPSPTRVATGVLGTPIHTPGLSKFRDKLARIEFGKEVERGDSAWREKDPRVALEAWTRAAELLRGSIDALQVRLRAAQVAVLRAKGAAAERDGRLEDALDHLQDALKVRPNDPDLLAAAQRVERRLEKTRKLEKGLRKARVLAFNPKNRAKAIETLRGLMLLAKDLDRVEEVEAALEKLGARDEPKALSADAKRLLDQAAALVAKGSWDAAEMAIRRAKRSVGADSPALRAIERRLQRSRDTPKGMVYLERDAGVPNQLPAGFYAHLSPVTNREYLAWFEEASRVKSLRPPSSWGGVSRPPRRTLDRPVRGVRRQEARRFAESRGERLPTRDELALLAKHLDKKLEAERKGRFPQGFRTVRDAR